MLNRKNRLTTDKDFRRIFQKGKRFYGNGINLVVFPNEQEISRFGFVVGTKVDKRAVVRNRIQRQMREIIRLRIEDIRPGFDGAFIADKKVLGVDFDSLTAVIAGLLKKSKLISG
jgi:ribonuclease P protein component